MVAERFVFPLDCPDCKSAAGYPSEAATMRGNVTTVRIGLRCRGCQYEWQLELDTDPVPGHKQEPDRDEM
jgi:hypothetical protein